MPIKRLPTEEHPSIYHPQLTPEWDKRLNFLGNEISLSNGSKWVLVKPFTRFVEEHNSKPPEGRVTCLCQLSKRPAKPEGVIPDQAVIKIRIQLRPQPSQGSATLKCSRQANEEIEALQQLTNEECDSAPWIITSELQIQGDRGFVKDGYICFLLMTKLPGQSLCGFDFWALSFSQRSEIKKAFKEAYSSVLKAKIYPCDPRLENLIWEPTSRKCYIIDFENSRQYSHSIPDAFPDSYFLLWGLARDSGNIREPWG